MMSPRLALILALSLPTGLPAQELPADPAVLIEEGIRHFENRALGAEEDRADPAEVDRAIAAFRRALELDPSSLVARGRLLRALYFKGQYATPGREEKERIFKEGAELADETLDRIREEASKRAGRSMAAAGPLELAPFVKEVPGAVDCFFWSAANWGGWAQAHGILASVRQGLASRIRVLGQAVVEMDPRFAGGGGYRVLGRLHYLSPSIPFLTGWVSKPEAVRFLRLAVGVDPVYYANRLYLAEALWDRKGRASRDEAVGILEGILNDTPRPEFLVEERAAQKIARDRLAEWGREPGGGCCR